MTDKDYSNEANIKLKEVQYRIKTVILMREFLAFINAKQNAYHIIKDTKLYNPLYELAKKLDKQFSNKGPNYEQTKVTSFRSEEHTSELQSRFELVCRLLLEKNK